MRTIPAATQTLLENDYGQEIIIVLEVKWGSGTPNGWYADREIASAPYVKSKILQMSDFDEAVQVSGGGQSSSFSVTLDDTDGEIKAVFDANDIHKAPVRAWFYVAGSNFDTEKFSVFLGQINSPVIWSEGARQLSFSVVNRIEDVEVGFSAEEGAFPRLPEDLIGKTWPLCFGTTINVPALKAVPAVSGSLASGVGIMDFTLDNRIALAEAITCPQTPVGWKCFTTGGGITYDATCNIVFETDPNCLQARCVEIERLKLQRAEQASYEYGQITIFGGKNFPQGNTITLNINGGLFTGHFDGTKTNPSETFIIKKRKHPLDDGAGGVVSDPVADAIKTACPGKEGGDSDDSDFQEDAFGTVFTGLRTSRLSWEAYRAAERADFFWAGGGTNVTLEGNNDIVYIANIVPSTILRVAAWRTLNGNQFLLTVPDEFYTVRQTNYGGYQVMEVVFNRPLSVESKESGGGWSDDIYITQISTVGPNTVDIIEWFIDTYTSYAKDSASFAAVKTAIDNYPMHFPLLRRPNLINILQELAQLARCALWQKDDTFYIKYLADEPTSVATITEDDVLVSDLSGEGTLEIELTKTEDIVTKLTSRWQKDYSTNDKNTLILRHNIVKYGTHAKEVDYFPYAHLDLVRKSSTFWLIRWANTWKKVRFSTTLEFMKLEAFDAITLDLPDIAAAPFKAIVEKATLDSSGRQINFECWTPIRAGESAPYNFAWPANIAEHALFPTQSAKNAKLAGSGTEPNFSTVAPPGHPLTVDKANLFTGFTLGCNGVGVTSLKPGDCRQDHGDGKPSDIGDVKPTVDVSADSTGDVSSSSSPISNGAGYGFFSDQQYGQDQGDKTEGDASRGREQAAAANSASQGGGGGSGDPSGPWTEDDLKNLPTPEELPPPGEDECRVTIFVSVLGRKEQGTRPICVPNGNDYEERYVTNSLTAAAQFCENIKAGNQGNCGSTAPCPDQCIAFCSISSVNCTGLNDGDGSILAYSKDTNPGSPCTAMTGCP